MTNITETSTGEPVGNQLNNFPPNKLGGAKYTKKVALFDWPTNDGVVYQY